MAKKIRIPKPIPSVKKIGTRGVYELLWGAKKRDYGKRIKTGKY